MEKKDWTPSQLSRKARRRLPYFLALSHLLFKKYQLGKNYLERTSTLLQKFSGGNKVLKMVSKLYLDSKPMKFDSLEFSSERLDNTFQTYVLQSAQSGSLQQRKRVFERELLLSELFTARQKMLLKKRLTSGLMTKTEREYFSRVLKKRLKALADDELHQMAREALMK